MLFKDKVKRVFHTIIPTFLHT